MSSEELNLIDKHESGTLSQEEQLLFDEKMGDSSFREQVGAHRLFIKSLAEYDKRKSVKQLLDTFHEEILVTAPLKKESFSIRTLWPTIGIAASVALVCAVGTLFIARWFDQEHQTNYQELRKNVERLKKSQSQILENIKENKKKDAPSKYSGSGFLVSPSGYVITSYHVVKAADSVYIENEKYGKLKTSVVYANPSNDIAMLMIVDDQFQKEKTPACSIRSKAADIGENVYTLGFPREDVVFGEGSISAATGYEQNENAYQVSVPVNPGNSGGPLIDQQGALVGIINGVQTQTQGAAFAIKSGVLLETLKSIPADSLQRPLRLSYQNQLAGLNRVNQIKRWKDLVFIVRVYH